MRLIDADELNVQDIFCSYDTVTDLIDVAVWLDHVPTVDAVPRSMLDAAIADIPHTCPTCGHNRKDGCALLEKCVKDNCWEWRGANE